MKGWRTVLFNSVMFATVAQNELTAILPPNAMKYLIAGTALGNVALRMVTTTAVGQKERP